MRHLLALFLFSATVCLTPICALSQTTDIDRVIDGNPALSAIVTGDPGREARIRERLRRAAAFGPAALEEEALRLGRQFANEMMPQLIGYASDGAVLTFLRATATALDEAAAQSGSHCHTFLIGGANGGQMPDFQPSTDRGISESLVEITTSGAERNRQRMLGEKEFMPILEAVASRTYEIAGPNPVNFDAVGNLPALQDDQAKAEACWTTIYFYQAILDLPPSDAAALFRTLMAAG